ncbi:MAG TPA: urease accessory protein UreF [Burkholderiales bacterium]|nr:urease accessory protein UreF [Burkholderiales bacterium]
MKLLQLASPVLPVGAYSYSQGLEAAVEAGIVVDAASAQRWIGDALELSVGAMEAPLLWRMLNGEDCDALFVASRETAELRSETLQMGASLARLLKDLSFDAPEGSYPAVYAFAARQWRIAPQDALTAYLWSWLENQVMAALKAVPLGQTDGQRMLLTLGEELPVITEKAKTRDLENLAPGLAFLSARHETQYSRLFRS